MAIVPRESSVDDPAFQASFSSSAPDVWEVAITEESRHMLLDAIQILGGDQGRSFEIQGLTNPS